MGTFINDNRLKISIIVIILSFLLAFGIHQIAPEFYGMAKWIVFAICLFALGRINFVNFSDSFDMDEHAPGYDFEPISKAEPQVPAPDKEKIITPKGGFSDYTYPSQKMSFWGGLSEDINKQNTPMKENNKKEAPLEEAGPPKGPEIILAKNTDESNDSQKPEPTPETIEDPVKVDGVKGYSLHNIHKRWRPMYQDVCSYAISSVKSEAEIDAVVNKWGNKNTKVRNGSRLVAYVVEHGLGNIRIPEAGFFEVK